MKNTSNVVRVCRVFDFDESPSEIYAKLCKSLSLLPAPWGLADVDVITFEDRSDWPVNEVSYRLHEEVSRLEIGLLSRRYLRHSEVAPCLEDYMTVEFNSAKNGADLKYVFDQVIPLYIRSFGAFFAAVEDMDVLAEEEDEFWKSSDEERMHARAQAGPRRQECLHIRQVNYWAREQCNNYFGLAPEQVVGILGDHVARADVLEEGAYIVVSYDPLTSEQAQAITPALMPLLKTR